MTAIALWPAASLLAWNARPSTGCLPCREKKLDDDSVSRSRVDSRTPRISALIAELTFALGAELLEKGRGTELDEEPIEPEGGTHARPSADAGRPNHAVAMSTSSRRRAVSASSTRRPNAVIL